jgi:hypothetical protein
MIPQDGIRMTPGAAELEILRYLAAGQDPFTGCHANGDFRKCLQALAELRRAQLIDRLQRLTASGRAALAAAGAQ